MNHNIRKDLEGMLESGIYFEGLPFVEFSQKQMNWESFCNGILSPSNTKLKEYIQFLRNKKQEHDMNAREKEKMSNMQRHFMNVKSVQHSKMVSSFTALSLSNFSITASM